ncbi:nuclear transport factor 2 family protein [Rhodococcus aerolatus]
MSTSEIATVLAWHDALNDRDVDTLLDLCTDDVDLGGADASLQGKTAVRRWAEGLGATLTVGRTYYRDGIVVAEAELATPSEPATTTVATAFRVVHDRVATIFRHDSLAEALEQTAMTESDEWTG